MERLLATAEKSPENVLGKSFDINNLSDVYEAIHIIQKEMGVTGTTAVEASKTFSGSFAAMKAAASNVMGALTTGEGLKPALEALGKTASTFIAGNLLPMIGNLLSQIPTMISTAVVGLTKSFPDMAKSATKFINGLTDSLMSEGGDKMFETGLKLTSKLAEAIGNNIGPLIAAAAKLIGALAIQIYAHMPEILLCGADIVRGLLTGMGQAIDILGAIGQQFLDKIDTSVEEYAQNTLKPAGEKIVKAISTAVATKFSEITKAVTTKMKAVRTSIVTAWNGIKATFTGAINAIRTAVTSGFNLIRTKIITPIKTAASKVSTTVKTIKKHLSFSGLASKVAGVFNSVRAKMTSPIEAAKNKITGIASSIVNAFKGLGRKIASAIGSIRPKISWKSVSVAGAKTPLKVPTVTFRKALSQPYMFDKSTFFAAGEAGDEMLYGRSNLMSDIKAAVGGASAGGSPVNQYITVNGAESPEEWARRFAREYKMEVRMA